MNQTTFFKSFSTKEIAAMTILMAIMIAFILYKLCYISVPYFWDESWVYGPALSEMGNRFPSLLPGSIDIELSRGHPMLFHFLGGLWGNFFGVSVTSLHIFALTVSLVLVAVLARVVHQEVGLFGATIAVLSLLTQGVFLAQSAMVLPEVMVSLFVLLSIYLWSREKYMLCLIFLSACLLTKESGLVLFPALGLSYLAHYLLINRFNWSSGFKIFALLIFAFLPYVGFLIYQNAEFGWYFYPNHMDLQVDSAQRFRIQLKTTISFILFAQNRVYLSLLIFSLALYRFRNSIVFWSWTLWTSIMFFLIFATQWNSWRMVSLFLLAGLCSFSLTLYATRNSYRRTHYLYLAALVFTALYLVFTSFNFYSARYLLCVFPLYGLMAGKVAYYYKHSGIVITMCVLCIVMQLVSALDRNEISDTTQSYIDVGQAQKELIQYLEANYQDHIILAPFLVLESLKKDFAGYKSAESKFTNLEYSPRKSQAYLSIVSPIEGEYNTSSRPPGYQEEILGKFGSGTAVFIVKKYYPISSD